MSDAAAAQVDQMLGCRPGSPDIVELHRMLVGKTLRSQNHHRLSGADQPVDPLVPGIEVLDDHSIDVACFQQAGDLVAPDALDTKPIAGGLGSLDDAEQEGLQIEVDLRQARRSDRRRPPAPEPVAGLEALLDRFPRQYQAIGMGEQRPPVFTLGATLAIVTARQNVDQEAANELMGGQGHDALPICAGRHGHHECVA